MTAGLVTASASVITEASAQEWILAGIVGIAALVTATTRIHPLIVLAAGALIGLSGIGQM
jgi:chromate transporter